MGHNFHPECFTCAYCGKIFANSPFYLEDGLPYCEEGQYCHHCTAISAVALPYYASDWNELFTTKCISCGFPIEAGDRWVEALNNNYHSQCFNCSVGFLWIWYYIVISRHCDIHLTLSLSLAVLQLLGRLSIDFISYFYTVLQLVSYQFGIPLNIHDVPC